MSEDLCIAAIWFAVVFGLASITQQLFRWAGVLVASQGVMVLIGAFSFGSVVRSGYPSAVAVLVAVVVCAVAGIAHRSMLYTVGPLLFVLLCIASDVFLAELWIALPSVTGGSGGLLLPDNSTLVAAYSSVACFAVAVGLRLLSGDLNSYRWATVRGHGWNSGLFGVNDQRSFASMFGAYGIASGFAGSAVAASAGYVSPSGLHLAFTIAIVMTATAAQIPGLPAILSLSGFYAVFRTILRQSVEASPAMAMLFEVSYPILLLLVVGLQFFIKRKST